MADFKRQVAAIRRLEAVMKAKQEETDANLKEII
jgi:hypothetical protein